MRTLTTQMRLRRLLRTQAGYAERLTGPGQTELPAAMSARLLELVHDVRTTWERESGGVELAGLHGYVLRSLVGMEAAPPSVAVPGGDLGGRGAETRDAGLPLVFFLRGLDDSDDPVLAELARPPLRRSA